MELKLKQQEIKTILQGIVDGYDVTVEYNHVKGNCPEYVGVNANKEGVSINGGYYTSAKQFNVAFNNCSKEDFTLLNDLYSKCIELSEGSCIEQDE